MYVYTVIYKYILPSSWYGGVFAHGHYRDFVFYCFSAVWVDSPKSIKHRTKIIQESLNNDQKSMEKHQKSRFEGLGDPLGGSWGHLGSWGRKKHQKQPKSSHGESLRVAITSSIFPKKLPRRPKEYFPHAPVMCLDSACQCLVKVVRFPVF